jgi:hypothetical protein
MRRLSAARAAVMTAVAAIDADMRRMIRASGSLPPAHDNPRCRPADRARLCRHDRRSLAHPPLARCRRLSRPRSKTLSIRGGRLRRRHLEMRRPAGADPPVRSRQRHPDPLQGPAQTQGLGLRNREAIKHAQGASLWRVVSQSSCTRCSGTEPSSSQRRPKDHGDGDRIELPQGATSEGGSRRRRRFCSMRSTTGRLRLQPCRPAPKLTPSSASERAENAGIPRRR